MARCFAAQCVRSEAEPGPGAGFRRPFRLTAPAREVAAKGRRPAGDGSQKNFTKRVDTRTGQSL